MEIFLAFLQGRPGHSIPAYSFWEYYVKNGIEESGHSWMEATEVDWAEGLVLKSRLEQDKWKAKTWEQTISFLKKHPVDLFLSYLYPTQVDCHAVSAIKAMGIPTVNFFCDNVREFRAIPPEFEIFDLNWVPEFGALSSYKAAGIPFLHLPMPMWVEPKYRQVPSLEKSQISFIGSYDIQRQLLFEKLLEQPLTFDFRIYGTGWTGDSKLGNALPRSHVTVILEQMHFIRSKGIRAYARKIAQRKMIVPLSQALKGTISASLDFQQYICVSQESAVTLGVNRYPSYQYPFRKPNTYSRLRDIEAPMLGACYLTEWTPGIENMYEIGSDIETYRTGEELHEKIEQLIVDPGRRKKMRRSAQQRALTALCIPNTLRRLKEHLNIKK